MFKREPKWWETSVIYQIYPLTFADANGDGIGDLQGIIQRLDYLNDGKDNRNSLGVDAIWLSPINTSPMFDNGYDVSDYYDICKTFGTLDDFKLLLSEAHHRNIKVILDLVINHTSNEHPWFLESRSSRYNPKSDWYLWHDPAPDGGVPNNWLSYFGGTGWTYDERRQQYYYHAFNTNQPDLNWHNPEVRSAIYNVIRYWLDLGVDGFRLDASSVYSQDKYFRNNPLKFEATGNKYNDQFHIHDKNLPENHEIIREIRRVIEEYDNRLLIGETFIDNRLYDSLVFYGVNNDELHLPFTFEFPLSPWYPGYLQREIEKKELLTPKDCWQVYFLNNHDLPRHLSRWSECSLCFDTIAIAQAAATILLTVRGTPILYYGEELGMMNHENIPIEQVRDKAAISCLDEECLPSRDGTRTPMQWDDSSQAGFSFGKDVTPWLPVHENYEYVNVKTELAEETSILNFYRALIQLRKDSEALKKGSWKSLIYYPYEHLAYLRETEEETILVVINFSYEKNFERDRAIPEHNWEVLLSTWLTVGEVISLPKILQPFEVSIYRFRGES
ncbi:alpha-glucosidase [Euhalothece natronophila Z-M001]|uniref:Alpha-glucosidase n=1 Tax=Euhalothece natronophila Z-M001 TaxID=522448 RepID=A0A5B8NNX5_9CHRO|nr:alpha-amylase family glycosyl hydrolase [Euhalothece natronophila]QDZ39895.1 alpha-glucosidase [Euhalothece natronophila Z-M001]